MISSANRRQGYTQVQGPRSVNPYFLLDVLYAGGDYSGGSGEIAQARGLRDVLDALDVPSPSLYILG